MRQARQLTHRRQAVGSVAAPRKTLPKHKLEQFNLNYHRTKKMELQSQLLWFRCFLFGCSSYIGNQSSVSEPRIISNKLITWSVQASSSNMLFERYQQWGARHSLGAGRFVFGGWGLASTVKHRPLVKNQEVKCARFSNFNPFCSQTLWKTSVYKLLQVLQDFVPQTSWWEFVPGPHWRTFVP